MTALPFAPKRRRNGAGFQTFSRRFMFVLCLGVALGIFVALGLYVTKVTIVALLPIGVIILVTPLFFKNFRLYWFIVFLVSLQLPFSKNLNDGLAVVDALQIDYTIWDFTFEITITDLVLVILLAIWANDYMFRGRPLRFPAVTWLAVGYLGFCLISTVGAASPYLGFVELSRQVKFFIVYLFTVNCLESKSALRALAIVGVITLVTQAGVTVTRSVTGYLTPLTLGDTHQDEAEIEQYLAVDRSDEGSMVRGFGTMGSPGSTVRLCMMVIPFGLLLCAPNAMFKMRFLFLGLTVFGIAGLVFTFTRVYYITTAIQIALAFLIMLRDRMLKRQEIILVVMIGLAGAAAAAPKLYEQFTVREDSVSVRFLQYEATGKMILDHPLFGVGLNNGTGQKPKYSNITYNEFDPDTQFYLEPTHNIYLSLTSEIGIFGALLYFGFFARITWLAWKQSRVASDPELRLVANVFVVTFLGVAVNSLMDPLFEYPVLVLMWLYAGITLNLPNIDRAQNAMASPSGKAGNFGARSISVKPGLTSGF